MENITSQSQSTDRSTFSKKNPKAAEQPTPSIERRATRGGALSTAVATAAVPGTASISGPRTTSQCTPSQPVGGGAAAPSAAPAAPGETSAEEDAGWAIYAVRLGCMLHILHIAVTAGLTSVFFMGPLGKGAWHEWDRDHVFSLLGIVWYNTSRSNSSDAQFQRWATLVAERFPPPVWPRWVQKFVRPAETRWMVALEGARILDARWEQVQWLFCEWAATHINKTTFRNYWVQSAWMLEDPYMRVQVMFAARLSELLLEWAYCWLRGEGGYFLEGEGVGKRLFPGMRLVEAADFSLLFLKKLETLRRGCEAFFPALLQRVRTTLTEQEQEHFMVNFSEDRGFFAEVRDRWSKWMERHQELPLSLTPIRCSSFFVGKGLKGEKPVQQAVGPEFASAFLNVGWPGLHGRPARSAREDGYEQMLARGLDGVNETRKKDELTLGLFSLFDQNVPLRDELERYALSTHGDREIDDDSYKRGVSAFEP